MTSLGRPVQARKTRTLAVATALAALAFYAPGAAAAPPEVSSAEVVAARELFRDATADFDAERYEAALAKFRRVADVRETAQVRFNIAQCEERLGKLGSALGDYELAQRETTADAKGDETQRIARDHAESLRSQSPRLTVTLKGFDSGAEVFLDGARLASVSVGIALPVDSGKHVVEVRASGYEPAKREVLAANGQKARVEIDRASLTTATDTAPSATSAAEANDAAPVTKTHPLRPWGIVSLVTGAALGAGAVGFLASHNGAVTALNEACPGGVCPQSRQTELQSKLDGASRDQSLSIGLTIGAGVAAVTGIVLIALPGRADRATRAAQNSSARVTLGAAGADVGASFTGSF